MRLFVIATAAIALVGATNATGAPTGFTVAPRLAPAASFVAGKPITVSCATTQYDWQQYLGGGGLAGDLNGATVPGSSAVHLAPVVCQNLRLALAGKAVRDSALGPSILVLVHESVHTRGETNEGITDCDAVHEMPRVAVKFFHVASGRRLRAVMAATWAYRSGEAAAYRTVC